MPRPSKSAPEPEPCAIVGTARLAAIFNVADMTITRWHNQGMPRIRQGRWDLGACLRWRLARLDARQSAADPRVALLDERAEGLAIENRRFRQTHVPLAEADAALGHLAAVVARELATLAEESPATLAGATTAPEVQARLFAACRRTRERIAAGMDTFEVSHDD